MKKMKRIGKRAVAIVLAGTFCAFVNADSYTYAEDSIADLREQNEEAESKKEEAQAVVDQLSLEQDDIVSAISELDAKVSEYEAKIVELQAQQETLEASISTTKTELEAAKAEEDEQYEAMKQRIKYSYENGNIEYLDTVFASSDVSEIINQAEYSNQIYNYDSKMLGGLIEIKTKIADQEAQLEAELNQVETIKAELSDDVEAVEILIDGKTTQLASYEDNIEEYQALVAQYQAEIDERDAKIAKIEEERRAAEAAAIAAGQNVTIYYTGGKFQWPVATGGTVTSRFGARWGTIHQGFDIACPIGTPILAGESGVVIASYLSASAGEYIVIDHGGGVCTEYMHNSTRLVSVGQSVSRGQVIAYSGNTGFSTGPHCHFGLRINGTRVDPEPYL